VPRESGIRHAQASPTRASNNKPADVEEMRLKLRP